MIEDINQAFEDIAFVLNALIEKPFVYLSKSYGDEYVLHFGEYETYDYIDGKYKLKGEYKLGLRGSSFSISPIEVNKANTLERMADLINIHLPLIVSNINPVMCYSCEGPGIGLKISLEDKADIIIQPSFDDRFTLNDWEFFGPDKLYMSVGPGMKLEIN